MNRYRFIRQSDNIGTKELAKAKQVSDLESVLASAKCIGEYVFTANKELSEFFRQNAKSVSIVIDELKDGTEVNRAVIVTDNGKYRVRCYGQGRDEVLPEKVFTEEECKKAVFGYCTSDGEKVCETRISPEGEVVETPVIYLQIA